MSPNLAEQLGRLPELLGQHVRVTGLALLVGLLLALPLGVVAARSRGIGAVALGAAGIVQTIPSLALLALMVPLLGQFGFWPALIALVLYSVLPILRNTVVGLRGVPAELVEAGRATGMTPGQLLRIVELPLALPVVLAGVRTATVWVVGAATLSTPVGQPSLGNLVFAGLQTRNWTAVLVGCGAAAGLAVTLDVILAALERALGRRSRGRAALAAAGLATIFTGGALLPMWSPPLAGGRSAPGAIRAGQVAVARGPVVIGAKTFTEQYILAELIELRLRDAGLEVKRADSLGSSVAFDALRTGQLDVYVEYTGTLWSNAMKRASAAPRWQVTTAVGAWLAENHGIRALGTLGFENAYAFAMRRDRAEALGVRSIADLSTKAPRLRLGSDYEFFSRPEWAAVREAYGLAFAALVSFDSSLMYDAVARGEVDVITAFSSDGRIAALDLVVLDDPLPALPPYDAILLLGPRVAADARIADALAPLVGALPVDRMRRANGMVDRATDKRPPRDAALWLLGKGAHAP